MKSLKKKVCMILAFILAWGMLGIQALADDAEVTKTTVTFNQGNENATYNAYELMSASRVLVCQIPEDDNHTHVNDCYQVGYTVNEKYKDIIKSALPSGVADDHIIETISEFDTDATRTFAEAVYSGISDQSLPADAVLDSSNNKLDFGYYLIVETTETSNESNAAKSLVMLDTAFKDNTSITVKRTVPTLEKKVWEDEEFLTDDENSPHALPQDWNVIHWKDNAEYDIGDTVVFKLTADVPERYDDYDTYKLVFHDTMSSGLTYENNSLKVYLINEDNGKFILDSNPLTEDSLDVDTDSDGTNIAVTFNNLKENTDITACDKIMVIYKAKLNENAVIGADGNPNTVYLEFSNDPYDSDETGKTPNDTVKVYTFEIKLEKRSERSDGDLLDGAKFRLLDVNRDPINVKKSEKESTESGNVYYIDPNGSATIETAGGVAYIKGLDADGPNVNDPALIGTVYHIEETAAPDGYNAIKTPKSMKLKVTYNTDPATQEEIFGSFSAVDDSENAFNLESGKVPIITIVNKTGPTLPTTGGAGTTLVSILGILLMAGASFRVGKFMKRKHSK